MLYRTESRSCLDARCLPCLELLVRAIEEKNGFIYLGIFYCYFMFILSQLTGIKNKCNYSTHYANYEVHSYDFSKDFWQRCSKPQIEKDYEEVRNMWNVDG